MRHARTLLLALLLPTVSLLVSACNTVAGFGKDVQVVGEKVEETARKNK